MGRPSLYSEQIARDICERIASGQSLKEICQADDMPAMSTVFLWLNKHQAFSEMYARAREAQADTLFDEILEIADDGRNDWIARHGDNGQIVGWQANGEALRRSALRVDARKWMAAKLRPRKYGDRTTTTVEGGETPLKVEDVSPLEAARKIAFALALGQQALKAED